MNSLLADYAQHLGGRQLASGSLAPYKAELRRLALHLDQLSIPLSALTLQVLLEYLAAAERAPTTRRRAQHIIHQFLIWAGHPLALELASVALPRLHAAVPDYLSEPEESALRKTLKTRTDRPHQLRDRALLCLLLDTGLRVAEASSLVVGDVVLEEKRVKLVGKGGKKRSRFLPVETRDLLKPLVIGHSADAPLFQTRSGQALSDRHIRRILTQWAGLAGITQHVHPHLLRHTFATSLLKKTGNLRLVQLALDHESPKTTAIYAHVADEELRAAIEGRRG